MNLYTIVNVVLLLQLQSFQMAVLQTRTDTPVFVFNSSMLRQPISSQASGNGEGNPLVSAEGTYEYDDPKMEEPLENQFDSQETTVEPEPPVSVASNISRAANETREDSGIQSTTITPNTTHVITSGIQSTTITPNTTHPITENADGFNFTSVETDFNKTTTMPPVNSTEASPDHSGEENGVDNYTMDNSNVTTAVTELPSDTTTTPETYPKSTNTTGPSSTDDPMMSTVVESGFTLANISDRDIVPQAAKNKNSVAWGAILATGLAVCFVAMVAYVLLKKRGRRDFMHRKLVEEFPSDPVLRLDNNDSLDLKYDGSAYYNPGLQTDHIQMANFPQGHQH
ncbi:hypothetical protein DPEC_G00343670 [Dallia pectoralis]|uniref:Uncharacterized protein n=1 Tax=Dallia pectoralis TaxID=75939 RepID=A0ACC2F314_DALPE|nr:hypothetical protein DPEC_G00343670 [Dallia pectoralis]